MTVPIYGEAKTPSGPLVGLRVVDMTTSYAGPTASMYLADLGADVIKVEKPGDGDDARGWGPPFVNGESAWFASANRNKRSIVIDLRAPEGLETLKALIATADVFMQNLNPAKTERLGVHPEALHATHPKLIYCAMSGFGQDGPAHTQPGYDLAAQARSGLMSVTGARGGSPQRVSTALSDIVTGMCATLAISAAAVRQQKEGKGDTIDVSLFDSDLALMAPRIASFLAGEEEPAPSGGTDSVLSIYQSFQTADRDIIVAIGNNGMWVRFAEELGLAEMALDPELGSNAGRREHRARIIEAVQKMLLTRTAAEWLRILASINVAASSVQTLSEVVVDEQTVARNALLPVPGMEGLFSVHSPFRLESVGQARNGPVATLGQHSREILDEIGLDTDRIDALLHDGVVCEAKAQANEEVTAHG